jgi:choline-glycine betaine transporter
LHCRKPKLIAEFCFFFRVSTAAPVGMLIARLSHGCKLWEVIAYSMAAPAGFCLVWFCIWGGVAIRQSRQSIELAVLGEAFFNSSDHFLVYSPTVLCYEVPASWCSPIASWE